MICRSKKIMFVHIPGTAGTTIETALVGEDWWTINPVMKHASLSVHQKAFRVDVRDFFVFTIVRNPIERVRSLYTRFGNAYGFSLNEKGEIEVDEYLERHRVLPGVYIEQQPAASLAEIGLAASVLPQRHHVPRSVYGNYVDGPSLVYKFEEIDMCFRELSKRFSIPLVKFQQQRMASPMAPKPPLSRRAVQLLRTELAMDFDRFGYA